MVAICVRCIGTNEYTKPFIFQRYMKLHIIPMPCNEYELNLAFDIENLKRAHTLVYTLNMTHTYKHIEHLIFHRRHILSFCPRESLWSPSHAVWMNYGFLQRRLEVIFWVTSFSFPDVFDAFNMQTMSAKQANEIACCVLSIWTVWVQKGIWL